MRTKTPRLTPLRDDQLDADQEQIMSVFRATGGDHGVSRTFVRNPAALTAFRDWAMYAVMNDTNALSFHDREILALRTAWRVRSGYEWSRHVLMGRKAGLSDEEIEALKRPVTDCAWSASDAALIKSADALVSDFYIPDDVWAELSVHFTDRQCIDVTLVVGHFVMLAMFLNTAGVAIDPDVTLDPELDCTA